MTKADNTGFLLEAARSRSTDTRRRTMQAIAELTAAGEAVNPTAVARKAGVSRQWLYTFAEAHHAIRVSAASSPTPVPVSPPSPASWQQRLETLSDENLRLRHKLKELEELVATLYGLRRSEQSGTAAPRLTSVVRRSET